MPIFLTIEKTLPLATDKQYPTKTNSMLLTQIPNLYITHHPKKGRGVYCLQAIAEGSIIEVCPLIIIPEKDTQLLDKTYLFHYYFKWENNQSAIALGYGSLYNHAALPNAESVNLIDSAELRIVAIKDIAAGEEITLNYQGTAKEPGCKLWFEVFEE